MQSLIQDVFLKSFSNPYISQLQDSAVVPIEGHRLAITTDSYVVRPLFFPGGDIGSMAVHGTINDLAMSGATPQYLSAGFILEEGLSFETLERVVHSMADAAQKAGRVDCVWRYESRGSRKRRSNLYQHHGRGPRFRKGLTLVIIALNQGTEFLSVATSGSHGIAVMSVREGLSFASDIVSDSAPLHHVVADLLQQGISIHAMRDLTRGGPRQRTQ